MMIDQSKYPGTITPDLERFVEVILNDYNDDKHAWKTEKEKDGIIYRVKQCPKKPFFGVWTETIFKGSPSDIADAFLGESTRPKWDQQLSSARQISSEPDGAVVCHFAFKSPSLGVAARDVVVRVFKIPLVDGRTVLFYESVKDDRTVLPPKHVRAEIHHSGAVITPISANACNAVQIEYMDPKGKIPQWVLKTCKNNTIKNSVSCREFVNSGKV